MKRTLRNRVACCAVGSIALTLLASVACAPPMRPLSPYYLCVEREGFPRYYGPIIVDDVLVQDLWLPEPGCGGPNTPTNLCPQGNPHDAASPYLPLALDALDEPHLADKREQSVFRLMGSDGYNRFMIRAVRRADKMWLVVKGTRQSSLMGERSEQVISRRVQPLSSKQWHELEAAIEADQAQALPWVIDELPPDVWVHGGFTASLEVATPSSHYYVQRALPASDLEHVLQAFFAVADCQASAKDPS